MCIKCTVALALKQSTSIHHGNYHKSGRTIYWCTGESSRLLCIQLGISLVLWLIRECPSRSLSSIIAQSVKSFKCSTFGNMSQSRTYALCWLTHVSVVCDAQWASPPIFSHFVSHFVWVLNCYLRITFATKHLLCTFGTPALYCNYGVNNCLIKQKKKKN